MLFTFVILIDSLKVLLVTPSYKQLVLLTSSTLSAYIFYSFVNILLTHEGRLSVLIESVFTRKQGQKEKERMMGERGLATAYAIHDEFTPQPLHEAV